MYSRGYQKIWRYIRTMKYFSVMEIYILIILDNNNKITYEVLDEYLKHLNNFTIIHELEKDTYVLMKDLGELAPKVFDNETIYNPNEDKFILSDEPCLINSTVCGTTSNGKCLYRRLNGKTIH